MTSALKIVGESECAAAGGAPVLNIDAAGLDPSAFLGRASIITLGCAKNQVDSEVMLGTLVESGFEIVREASEADVIIVNTCGFLESAVQESIDRILEASDFRTDGRCRKLVVTGCMVERYRTDLSKELPEVDLFLTSNEVRDIGKALSGEFHLELKDAGRPYFLYDDTMPRVLSTPGHSAYVKIAEGCNRPCTFCIIPKIRGAMRSRPIESVVSEVADLGSKGIREVNLIAQDLTSYGTDRRAAGLASLLRALNESEAIDWIRLLYAYPVGTNEELLQTIVELPRVVEYLDIPLQHASESVLASMKRPLGKFAPRKLVEWIRSSAPSVHLRTTFIVGFPGETEADVRALEEFVAAGHFTNLGVFPYSKEEGTPSAGLPGQISSEDKQERLERIMLAQQRVNEERLEGFIGESLEVLIEGTHEDTDLLLSGRTRFQAPGIDGSVIINDIDETYGAVESGVIAKVEITESAGYDLVGKLTAFDG